MRRARRIGASSSMTRIRSPLMRLLLRSRDGEKDGCSFAGQALDPDSAAMRFDETLAYGETDAGAGGCVRRFPPHEFFENPIAVAARHPWAIVRHIEYRVTTVDA